MSQRAEPAGPSLIVVMYHYVRDLPNTKFPRIRGLQTDHFARQVTHFTENYELATLESALAFLKGDHAPTRDMCLLTFDDGLKDHYHTVTPILREAGIQGVFMIVTESTLERRVLPVHKNHFLMASLDFEEYAKEFNEAVAVIAPEVDANVGIETAIQFYRWDTPEVAAFKYVLNQMLPEDVKAAVLDRLFAKYLGDETKFANELYITWPEARQMQDDGMVLGGHSHRHRSLASLATKELKDDLRACRDILNANVKEQKLWPFSFPYGKPDTFNQTTINFIQNFGYDCCFSTEVGGNAPGDDLYSIKRLDPKDIRM